MMFGCIRKMAPVIFCVDKAAGVTLTKCNGIYGSSVSAFAFNTIKYWLLGSGNVAWHTTIICKENVTSCLQTKLPVMHANALPAQLLPHPHTLVTCTYKTERNFNNQETEMPSSVPRAVLEQEKHDGRNCDLPWC